jgi:hypothetical protein
LVSKFAKSEKAWVAWSQKALLSVFAEQPSLGPALFQMEPTRESAVSHALTVPADAQVIGVSNDGRSAYVSTSRNSQPKLERWAIPTGQRELVGETEAAFLREAEDGEWLTSQTPCEA